MDQFLGCEMECWSPAFQHVNTIENPKVTFCWHRNYYQDALYTSYYRPKRCHIQIKYGLPHCATCPRMSTVPGSLNPGTRRVLESREPYWILRQVTQFGQKILNLYYSTDSLELFWYPLTGILCQGGGSLSSTWKWKPVIRSPAHNPLLLQLPIIIHSMTLADIYGVTKLNSTNFVVVVIFITHKLHLLPVHCCW